jgi:hypothetical protein
MGEIPSTPASVKGLARERDSLRSPLTAASLRISRTIGASRRHPTYGHHHPIRELLIFMRLSVLIYVSQHP